METKLKSPCPYCSLLTHYSRGKWTEEEDKRLMDAVYFFSEREWTDKPRIAGIERCGMSCRNRWFHRLPPYIMHGHLSKEEEERMINLYGIHGNNWTAIADMMPGRTAKWIRHRCLTTKVRERLLFMGVGVAQDQDHQVRLLQPAEDNLELTLTRPYPL